MTRRIRSGFALPQGGQTTGGGATPQFSAPNIQLFWRWRFDDPILNTFYVFDVNPNAGGSVPSKRNMDVVRTTAQDGVPLIFEGETVDQPAQFSGVIRTQAQYDNFVTWFKKRYPIMLTDDLGRRSYITLTGFKPSRLPTQQSAFRMNYTADYQTVQRLDL